MAAETMVVAMKMDKMVSMANDFRDNEEDAGSDGADA